MFTILGAGLSGLTIGDLFQKKGIAFNIYEGRSHGGGHVHSEVKDGFTWDEGPHVSFTKSEFVKKYFAGNCDNHYLEFQTNPSNYFQGNWIPHPAQANLYAIPEVLRSSIIDDLKISREADAENLRLDNYQQWLEYAFGKTFVNNFPKAYTKKYWTTDPSNLSTDWIGNRIYFPDLQDVVNSVNGSLNKQTHYIDKIRYPARGGFHSFIKNVEARLPIKFDKRVSEISFADKQINFNDGTITNFQSLVSTLPLNELISVSDAPENIKQEALKLKCSKLLIVNIVVSHPAVISNQWIYVYDESFYSTRINFTELLSPYNGQDGKTGIQVEVYFSDYKKITESIASIARKVIAELVEMGLVKSMEFIEAYHTKWIEYANVIFDLERRSAQDNVLNWLETQGLHREYDDLEPMTNWNEKADQPQTLGSIILAGRFAQWKYFWTDDCVLRAKFIADNLVGPKPENKKLQR